MDDVLLVGPSYVRNTIEEEISEVWKTRKTGEVLQLDKKTPKRR